MSENKKFGEVSNEDIKLAQSAAPDDLKEKEPVNIKDELLEWAESFVFAVFIVILIFTFFFRIVQVKGNSMNDTLEDKNRLIINHINYTPEHGDVAVINSKVLNEVIIKRIIGVEGDKVVVDYANNCVSVNDEKISNSNIKEAMYDKTDRFDSSYRTGENVYEYTVPEGCVFVMGDNRNHSTDSREIGFINKEDILGKAVFRIYPFDEIGKVK